MEGELVSKGLGLAHEGLAGMSYSRCERRLGGLVAELPELDGLVGVIGVDVILLGVILLDVVLLGPSACGLRGGRKEGRVRWEGMVGKVKGWLGSSACGSPGRDERGKGAGETGVE